jgi:AcrR family transcriptional regulator
MNDAISRRERKKIETRQRLMEEAFRLFASRGYDATTVEEIATAASVAKGTFFNYFETKEAILPAIAEWRIELIEQALAPEEGAPTSPVMRIKLILRMAAEDPLTDRLMAEHLFAASAHERDVRPVRALTRLLAEQVLQAQDVGDIRAGLDPVYLGGVLRALFFQQLIMWHCGYRPQPLRALLDSAVELLLDGAGGPRWRHSS